MTRLLFQGAFWLLISCAAAGLLSCRSSETKKETGQTVIEMPEPASDADLDSLKRIQQQKRDSLRNSKKR